MSQGKSSDKSFSDPRLWPFRIIIIDRGRGTFRMLMFGDRVSRDRAAREMRLGQDEVAIAARVDYYINGGDEPKIKGH